MTRDTWTFFRAGGFDQVKLTSGADLMRLGELDQKLWVALACPTGGLELDARTLALIDTDKDGRVRAPELIAATQFAGRNLKKPDDLLAGAASLPLAAIADGHDEGRTLVAAARRILASLGKADAPAISIDDVADPSHVFADSAFNGDGVVTALSTTDDALKAVIGDIVASVGGDPDRSGQTGVTAEKIDAFFAEAAAFSAWHAKGEADAARVFPLGPEASLAAVAAVNTIRAKVDDYFARCRVVAYDPRAAIAVNRKEEEYLDIAAQDLTITADEVAGFPLATVAADRPLPLTGPVNPAHAAKLAVLRAAAVEPLLGTRAQLSEADWRALLDKIAPHEAWLAEKAGARVEGLGLARVRAILASTAKDALAALIVSEKAVEAEAASIENVERLVRYHRDLALLCTNFVNFEDFYGGGEPAIFQAGTLYLDQRSCTLCLKVADAGRHATMAGLAGAYLAYLDCTRRGSTEKMTIVAAFTAGDSENLMVGRNGLFYDRKGQDWDATITKILENPISIRQAFWAPYKKFVRMLEEQVAKRAAADDAAANDVLSATATTTANVGASAAKPPARKIDVGTVAALGVAVGAIGTFVTAIVGYATGLFRLGPLAVAGALVGVMMLISLPSVVMAFLKLRKRNLGPILDANGWAVNAKARLNIPFGATLTSVAKLPAGARRDSKDPYADKDFPWKTLVAAVLVVAVAYKWYEGVFDRLLPPIARSTKILGDWAPRSSPSAPSGPEAPSIAPTK